MKQFTSAYTLGTSSVSNAYFYRLARRFEQEREQVQGLVQDLTRSPFETRGRKVNLAKLAEKYRIKGINY